MNKKAKGKKKPAASATKNKGPKKQPRRAVQRLIALRMGLENGTIKAEELREACRKAGVYNAPNFKQDMKKEAALFTAIQKDGKTTGWKLTAVGHELAKQAPPPPKSAPKATSTPKKAVGKPAKDEKAAGKKDQKAKPTKTSAKKATKVTAKDAPKAKPAADKKAASKKPGGTKKANEASPAPTPVSAENAAETTETPTATASV